MSEQILREDRVPTLNERIKNLHLGLTFWLNIQKTGNSNDPKRVMTEIILHKEALIAFDQENVGMYSL